MLGDGRIGKIQQRFDLDGDDTDDEFLTESVVGVILQPVSNAGRYFACEHRTAVPRGARNAGATGAVG